jgi:hypothetical protein
MRWTSWFLGCWWRQTGLALFARRNVNHIHLLSVSQRVLMHYKRQAIGFVAGHYWHDDFGWRRR